MKPFLQQLSNGLVAQADVDYVLTVAHASRDRALSEAEVLQAGVDCVLTVVGASHDRAQADVDSVLTVADESRDRALSEAEVLNVIRAWYSWRNLPELVDPAVQAFGITEGPLPSAEELINFFEFVNESQPVILEEAAPVKSLALVLGATEDHVTDAQIRGAVAAWYLQIEREESGIAHLGNMDTAQFGNA